MHQSQCVLTSELLLGADGAVLAAADPVITWSTAAAVLPSSRAIRAHRSWGEFLAKQLVRLMHALRTRGAREH